MAEYFKAIHTYSDPGLDRQKIYEYELSVRIHADGLSYCIIDSNTNKFLHLETFDLGGPSRKPHIPGEQEKTDTGNLTRLLDSELQWLTQPFSKVRILLEQGKSTLVPEALFAEEEKRNIFEFNIAGGTIKEIDLKHDHLNSIDAYGIWQLWTGAYFWMEPSQADLILGMVYAMGTLLAVPVIAYGILQTQLFDIDLKIRWTIKQSTLAGIFVAIMFVISEGAAQFLEAELGNIAGLLAAAVVMFFLAPLQRFAERVASTAMPNTKNTPEYAAFRKMQVYESALMEAQFEEGVSDRERTLLNRLRESLGISEFDADAIENELQTRSLQAA